MSPRERRVTRCAALDEVRPEGARRPEKGAGLPARALADESGIALVITLLILVTLTFIGLASFFNSNTDVMITGNQKGTSQALYVAEAGIADMIDALNSNVAYAPPTPYTTAWAPADVTSNAGGFNYTVRVRHKVDTDDCDGDSVTAEVVKYDKACYPGSPIPAGGASAYPVEVVTSTATTDRYHNQTELEVTKQKFTYTVTGALTAQSDVQLNGNITVDGNTHDIDGNPSATACGGALPSGSTTAGNNVTTTGSPIATPAADNTKADTDQPDTPCEALGLAADCESTTLVDYITSAANVPPMNGDIKWVQENYASACLSGTGMLIVHTPGFDPKKCNPADAAYDAGWCGAHPPANLGNITGNCTFKGLIIADSVDKLAGSGTIIGAVISMTEIQADKVGAGTLTLKYSCSALDEFVGGKINHKLAWERM